MYDASKQPKDQMTVLFLQKGKSKVATFGRWVTSPAAQR